MGRSLVRVRRPHASHAPRLLVGSNMSSVEAFTGLPVEMDDGRISRWAAMLVKAVFAVLVIGLVLTLILWPLVSADAGALTVSIAFAGAAGLMVLRQALSTSVWRRTRCRLSTFDVKTRRSVRA